MVVHIRAGAHDVAPTVLLVGDPGRATLIAQQLEDATCYNKFRGLLGYTGRFHGVPVSVQTTGMGCPSAAIVCEELVTLGARTLIRLGTCGAVRTSITPTDLVIATAACPLDGTTRQYLNGDRYAPAASYRVVRALADAAANVGVRYHVGLIATQDALYGVDEGWVDRWQRRGVLAQEMEASIIFTIAGMYGLDSGCVLVASNAAGQHERLSDGDLAPAVDAMIRVGLQAVIALQTATPPPGSEPNGDAR
jgi:purine-nucleoside phosphorylase